MRTRGFTLIELLTVIAIIAILAAIAAVAAPRALERAKISRMTNAMLQIRNSLTAYYTTSSPYSYPPAYGFMSRDMIGLDPAERAALPDLAKFHLRPYLSVINLYTADVFDEFSTSYDTSLTPKNRISLLEFLPIPNRDVATDRLSYPQQLYRGNNLPDQVDQMLKADRRPFAYLPYNKNQLKLAKQYWIESRDYLARTWDPNSAVGQRTIAQIRFPAASYDAFVLIGTGPGRGTYGLLPEPLGTENPDEVYHICALRGVFLALRDLNNNGLLDFDYSARTREGEAAQTYSVNGDTVNNQLPDPVAPNGYGPWIFASESTR
jgi:prepilin-type N-terminal cleavage/methylation domain-containing protein